MAPAFSASSLRASEQAPAANEWQALRGELVALLDQVEGRFAPPPVRDPGYDALSQRMQELRHQVGDNAPQVERRQEALRSVQRAVERFNERGEPLPEAHNPQDTLQSAIREIRGNTRLSASGQSPRLAAPRLDDFAQSVNAMTARLGQLEQELRAQRGGAQSIREVAEQVGQLTHVVELLAGAVGETGQVKRLEGQIASLAQMIDQSAKPDLSALTMRLDDVSISMERLADMQAQVMAGAPSGAPALASIETYLRNVYDRIDTLEHSMALPSADMEQLVETVGKITSALQRDNPQTERLLSLLDDLGQRVDAFGKDAPVGGLQADVGQLRDAVVSAIEPRFAALEGKIETLSGRVDAGQKSTAGLGTVSEQIRQLITRMDETGAQITSLAELYGRQEPADNTDYERLADMVAARAVPVADTPDEFAEIRTGMSKVDDRLERLEALLSGKAAKAAETVITSAVAEPAPVAPVAKVATTVEPAEMSAAIVDTAPEPAPKSAKATKAAAGKLLPAGKGDAMPVNPADDAPLVDAGFADHAPLKAALEAKTAVARKPHPGIEPSADAEPAQARPLAEMPLTAAVPAISEPVARPVFDPNSVERPPRPESSLGDGRGEVFAALNPEAIKIETPQVKTSTFIEAARRATQRQGQDKQASGSLMGRAMARFQTNSETKPAVEVKAVSTQPAGRRSVLGRKPKAAPAPAVAPTKAMTGPDVVLGPELEPRLEKPKAGVLARHSKAILLACSVLALTIMAANLFVQRMNEEQPAAEASAARVSTDAPAPEMAVPPPADTSMPVSSLPPSDLVLPVDDGVVTGSITPSSALSFAGPTSVADMPAALQAASLTANMLAPTADAGTNTAAVAPPPAETGPEPLRMAAANGDPRAQFEIAAIYSEGRIVPEDFAASAQWYERSASQGFAPAQYRLANLYESGKGVKQDLEQARLWYERAAEAGNRMSMHNLAALYAGGNLGKQEFAKAAQWFEQAATRGMTDSQFNLGMLYARGLGVTQSLEQSYKWFSLAADKGDADAAKARDDVAASLDAATVATIKAEIAAWTPSSIDLAANFAPIGTWSKDFDPGKPVQNVEVVKKVQAALVRLGYDVGSPDGVYGPKTGDAIRAFERGTGMSESGNINPRLLAVLGSQPV